MPWYSIIMVSGVTVLIALLEKTGGLELFSAFLARVATPVTATAAVAFVTAVISVYSSTSGVVLPAFLPTIPGLIARLGGGDPIAIATSMNVGAHLVDMSPLYLGSDVSGRNFEPRGRAPGLTPQQATRLGPFDRRGWRHPLLDHVPVALQALQDPTLKAPPGTSGTLGTQALQRGPDEVGHLRMWDSEEKSRCLRAPVSPWPVISEDVSPGVRLKPDTT